MAKTANILQPLHRLTCERWQPKLRNEGFCWSKVLLPACPWWRQLVHLNSGEDARLLFNSVIYTVSVSKRLRNSTNNQPHLAKQYSQ